MINDSYYVLSLNILKALGGDVTIVYPDADAIWNEINKIYDNAGNRFDIVPLEKTITENGEYEYYPDGDVDAFMPVNLTVNIPQKYTDEQVFEIESNAIQQGYDNGYSVGESNGKLIGREEGYTDGFNIGYDTGVTDGGNAQKAKLVDITITESGVYTKDDGYKTVTVKVEGGIPEEELQQMLQEAMDEGYQDGYAEGVDDGREDGIAEQKEKLESTTFRDNGTYTREDGWNEVIVQVDVPSMVLSSIDLEVKNNGSYEYEPVSVDGWNKINLVVDVPTGGDTGKPKIYNGFRLTDSNSGYGSVNAFRQIDFSQYDWSGVYDTSYFFAGLSKSISVDDGLVDADFDNFRQHYNGKLLNCARLFEPGKSSYPSLLEFPNFGNMTNGCINMSYLCIYQNKLTNVDNIANWNTSSVLDMSNMFYSCANLTSVPLFDTSNVTTMSNMFFSCSNITTIPQFDTSNVTDMSSMFQGCSKLTTIPLLDCSNIGPANTAMNIFSSTTMSNLTDLGGFKDLGKVSGFTAPSYFLKNCPNLTKESVLNVINNLYDRASDGYSVVKLLFNSSSLALLSDEEKAIATNKGWTLATS